MNSTENTFFHSILFHCYKFKMIKKWKLTFLLIKKSVCFAVLPQTMTMIEEHQIKKKPIKFMWCVNYLKASTWLISETLSNDFRLFFNFPGCKLMNVRDKVCMQICVNTNTLFCTRTDTETTFNVCGVWSCLINYEMFWRQRWKIIILFPSDSHFWAELPEQKGHTGRLYSFRQ